MDIITLTKIGYLIKGEADVTKLNGETVSVDMFDKFIIEEEFNEEAIPVNDGGFIVKDIDSAIVDIYERFSTEHNGKIITLDVYLKTKQI